MTDTGVHERAPQATAPPRRVSWLAVCIAAVCLVGVAVMLYPAGARWFAALMQSDQVSTYTREVDDIGPAGRHQALAAAHAYNDALSGGARLAADTRIPLAENSPDGDDDYADLLAADDHGLMARIQIPSIDVDLPIYHGTSDDTLHRGVGHLQGTSLPVGGPGTNAVLTAHRGLASATLFTHLDRVHTGDTFRITVFGEVLVYRVIGTKVVDPDETESLHPVAGEDLVTLVTCTPLGVNSQRILVTGERVLPTPKRDADAGRRGPAGPGFPWWALGVGGTAVLGAGYVIASSQHPAGAGARLDA